MPSPSVIAGSHSRRPGKLNFSKDWITKSIKVVSFYFLVTLNCNRTFFSLEHCQNNIKKKKKKKYDVASSIFFITICNKKI